MPAYAMFAGWLQTLDQRGLLRADDPVPAAQHFNWPVLSIPLDEAMARPIDDVMAAREDPHRYADEGVRVFLAAYGMPAAASTPKRAS